MRSTLGVFVVATVAFCAPALAQESGVAEKLFREGKRLMGEGKVAEACKAFEGSYRKDAVVSTLLNLADCREKNAQYATAWGHFLDAERLARGQADQATFVPIARDRAAKLEPRLSYLIVNVPREANVAGLQISRNGVVVDEAEWNTDIPVDGGEYVVEGKAPGYEAWSTKVTVGAEKDKKSVNVPRFRERPGSGGVASGPVDSDGPDDRTPPPPRAGSGRKKLGIITMAGGGALVLGGLATGYLAQQKWSDAKAVCGDDLVCDTADDRARGQKLVDAARMRGNVSTVLTAGGIVAVGVGVALWLTAPSGASEPRDTALYLAPTVAPGTAGLVLGGSL
jgi:hypothetical protein